MYLGLLLRVAPAAAQENPVAETSQALVGLGRVNVALPADRHLVFAGTGSVGWFENFDAQAGSTVRLLGSLAVAYSPLPEVTVGAQAQGWIDNFSSSAKTSGMGIPQLQARWVHAFDKTFSAGLQSEVRFIGDQAPSRKYWVSPVFLAMATVRPGPATTLAANLGYLLDTSGNRLDDSTLASVQITLNSWEGSAIPWGIGVSQRFGTLPTEWLVETSGEILVGKNAPRFLESPWWVSVGARHPLSEGVSISARVEAALSARPDELTPTAQPLPARLAGMLTLLYRPLFHRHVSAKQEILGSLGDDGDDPPDEAEKIATSELRGRVIDEGGRPLPDVAVTLIIGEVEQKTERTYADGSFVFPEVEDRAEIELRIETPGFETKEVTIAPGKARVREEVLYPALPAGQVRGALKTLQGDPIAAKISILPGTETVAAGEDGTFEFELAPGRYTLVFEHDDFSPQKRTILVEERGVVILNIALTP